MREISTLESGTPLVELDKLVGLFFDQVEDLGRFQLVSAQQLPEPHRSLLDHEHHMTVTVEKFHSSPVNVKVLRERRDQNAYSREICLLKSSDQQTVQYGIVRLNFDHLDEDVQDEILKHQLPLGRILIQHDVLRQVRLLGLYEVSPSDQLIQCLGGLGGSPNQSVYGRTAIIYCNEEPAIELLEIVTV
ncbi:MAG: hypothetical protein AAGA30_11270 [Planctomycetota bacterium]